MTMRFPENPMQRIFNNSVKQNQNQNWVPQLIINSVQRPESRVQIPASTAQRLESRVQCPTLVSRVQEFGYTQIDTVRKSIQHFIQHFYIILDEMLNEILDGFLRFYTSIQLQLPTFMEYQLHSFISFYEFLFTISIYNRKLKMEAKQSLMLVVLSELTVQMTKNLLPAKAVRG